MIIYILIITHLLADFLFQSSAISERKREERKFFFFHCFIYFIVFEILFFIIFQSEKIFFAALVISFSHFFILILKNKLEKKFKQKRFQLLIFSFHYLNNEIYDLLFLYLIIMHFLVFAPLEISYISNFLRIYTDK